LIIDDDDDDVDGGGMREEEGMGAEERCLFRQTDESP
jgi:hypothetical protein